MRNEVENNSDNDDDDDYHDGYKNDDNVHECENNMTRIHIHNRIKNLKSNHNMTINFM